MVPLKYLSNFWRTFEVLLINCEISLILTWFSNFFVIANHVASQVQKYAATETKTYVLVVILSTQDNAKFSHQLKSGFKRAISWKKYQLKVTIQRRNQYFDDITDANFQRLNTLFLSSFKDDTRTN